MLPRTSSSVYVVNKTSFRVEKYILTQLNMLVNQWKDVPSAIGRTVPIPHFDVVDLNILLDETVKLLHTQPPLIQKKPSCIVVGDLHGNLLNFLQILSIHGLPPEQNYVFLGNYINFGEFSLEVMVFIFALYLSFPENITLLRSECEFVVPSGPRSLAQNISDTYEDSQLLSKFTKVFTVLPLACILSNNVICCRSSLPIKYRTINEIKAATTPVECFEDTTVMFKSGFLFVCPGDEVFEQFLAENDLSYFIIGGEAGGSGVLQFLNGHGIAINSDTWMGSAAVVHISGDSTPLFVIFTPDSIFLRRDAQFTKIPRISGGIPRKGSAVTMARPVCISTKPNAIGTPKISNKVRLPALSPQPITVKNM